MSDDVIVRRYDTRDQEHLMQLLREVYPDVTSPAAFSWRFEQNPAGKPILVVAEDSNGIIGFNSWIPWPLRWQGRDLRAWQSGESAVHPRARGKGVFGRLLRKGADIGATEGGDLFIGFPNQASLGSFLRADWKLIHTLRWWVRPTPASFLGLRLGRLQSPDVVPLNPSEFEFVRSEEFVRWRIDKNPYHRFRVDSTANGSRIFSRVRRRAGLPERFVLAGISAAGALLYPRQAASHASRNGARGAILSFAATEALGKAAQRGFRSPFFPVKGKGIFFIVFRLNSSIDERFVYSADGWKPSPFEVDIL